MEFWQRASLGDNQCLQDLHKFTPSQSRHALYCAIANGYPRLAYSMIKYGVVPDNQSYSAASRFGYHTLIKEMPRGLQPIPMNSLYQQGC